MAGVVILATNLLAQSDSLFTITVRDVDGILLEGVQIYDDDLKFTSISDLNGEAEIADLTGSTILNLSYIGYTTLRTSVAKLRQSPAVILEPSILELDEVEIIGRYGMSRQDITQQIDVVDRRQISFTNPQTTADAIDQHTGLFVQRSQMGGGSPIIRGFEANKILLVVDGVRLNNAIYRNGHLQNSITVGSSTLERIEVLYGPGSLTYGSDALGGVIHFRTRDPKLSDNGSRPEVHAGATLRYATVNMEKTGQAYFEIGGRRFASLTSFSYSDFDDLRTGSNRDDRFPDYGKRPDFQDFLDDRDTVLINKDPNIQIGTAYAQYDILQKFKYRPSEYLQIIGNFQFSNSSDVPRYDNLSERDDETDLRWSEWYYGPQKRLLASTKVNWFKKNRIFDNAQWIFTYQDINEDRITRRFGRDAREYQEEDVRVLSSTLDFTKSLDQRGLHRLEYGMDLQKDDVRSVAFSEDIRTLDRQEDILTRYPDGSSGMLTIGGYLKYLWKNPSETSHFEAGARYAHAITDMLYVRTDIVNWPEEFIEGVENRNGAFTGALSWRSQFTSWLRYRVMASSAYRVPNIDDLAKIRVRAGNVLVPNLDIEPERSYTFEATISPEFRELIPIQNSSLQLDITAFYTKVANAIVRSDYQLPNGDTLLEVSGDQYRVQANINAESAYVFGISANLKLTLTEHWILQSSFNFQHGRSEIDNAGEQPLAHIPPNYGKTSVAYAAKRWRAEFTIRYNGNKPLEDYAPGSSDNEDFATPIGALAWTTLNLYGSYQFTENFAVTLGLENIADLHYRMFSSGVSAPGRNFFVALTGSF